MDEGKVFKRKPSKCPGWSASVHSPLHAAHAADGAVLEEAGTEVDWQQEVSSLIIVMEDDISSSNNNSIPGPRAVCSRSCSPLPSSKQRE